MVELCLKSWLAELSIMIRKGFNAEEMGWRGTGDTATCLRNQQGEQMDSDRQGGYLCFYRLGM